MPTFVKRVRVEGRVYSGGIRYWLDDNLLLDTATGGAPITGTIAAGQVAYGTGTNTVGGDTGLTYDAAANTLGIDNVQFDLTPTPAAPAEGQMYWNADDGTVNIGMPGGNVNLQVGQEMLLRVRNTTGAPIANGSVVYISGEAGGKALISLADPDSVTTAAAVGMATETIAHNSNGYVCTRGFVRDVNTNAYTAGTVLWLSDNGTWSSTKPTAPRFSVVVGVVVVQGTGNGVIYTNIDIVPRLDSLSNVYISGLAGGDLIRWNAGDSRWENAPVATAIAHNLLTDRDAAGSHPATAISNTPAGTIAATDVQAALNELDSEKVPATRTVSTTAPLAGGGALSADLTLSVGAATESAAGVAELATTAEAQTGTDTTRIVTPAGLRADVPATPAASRGVRLDANGDLLLPSGGDVLPDGATDVDHGVDKRLRDVSGPVGVGDYGYNPAQILAPESAWYLGVADNSARDDFFRNNYGGAGAAIWTAVTGCTPSSVTIERPSWLRLFAPGAASGNHAIMQASITHAANDEYTARLMPANLGLSDARVGLVVMASDLLTGAAWWYTYTASTQVFTLTGATYSSANAWLSQANAKTSSVGYTTDWTTRYTGTAFGVELYRPMTIELKLTASICRFLMYAPLYATYAALAVNSTTFTLSPAYLYLFVEGNLASTNVGYFDFVGKNIFN